MMRIWYKQAGHPSSRSPEEWPESGGNQAGETVTTHSPDLLPDFAVQTTMLIMPRLAT